MADNLDSLVKGVPLPLDNKSVGLGGGDGANANRIDLNAAAGLGGLGSSPLSSGPIAASAAAKTSDPLSHTPSSPSMIYLNMLVLEASLRAQYLALRARRRHHMFFLILLSLWIGGFGYALFLAPREDGSGVGGSVYWVVDVTEKVCFMGGIITAALIWATGIFERGVRWPRRWFSVSNRGLRHINCKLILLKRSWWAEIIATLVWFLTYGVFSNSGGTSSYRYVDAATLREVDRELSLSARGHPSLPTSTSMHSATSSSSATAGIDEEKATITTTTAAATTTTTTTTATTTTTNSTRRSSRLGRFNNEVGHEEDLAPGGDYVKLLLLAKPFSPNFRENWEIYRQEYWDRENERRALLRKKIKQQDRALLRSAGVWLWWLPGRTVSPELRRQHRLQLQQERSSAMLHHHHQQHHHLRHAAVEREHRRARSNSARRSSMSAGGRRSSTPTKDCKDLIKELHDFDDGNAVTTTPRKASASSSTVSDRRRKKSSLSGASGKRPSLDVRSATPETPSPLSSVATSDPGPIPEDGLENHIQ